MLPEKPPDLCSLFDGRAGTARAMRRAVLAAVLLGCASSLPPRFVIERDVGALAYRRYQKVLDMEFGVPGNQGVGHTATYIRRLPDGHMRIATAFVTVYEKAPSLAAEVRDRLAQLGTYDVSVEKVAGEFLWSLEGGDRWLLWVSENRVVKLAVTGHEDEDQDLAEAYLDLYPSDLSDKGRARKGAKSAGPSTLEREEAEELAMPAHLREGAPR